MLRRRIFSSAMASVMALSSIAVVANAEEAVSALKTKADLEVLLTETYGDAYRSGAIYDFGSRSAEKMQDALDHADNVLANPESTDYDYTTAYDMVIAVYNRLQFYSAEELKALLDSCKKDYEDENIYNEELGDLVYTPDSFEAFEDAYEAAEDIIGSNSARDITDAWIELNEAFNALSPYEIVTKAQFTAAIKSMEKALDKEKAYDQWRRGVSSYWAGFYDTCWYFTGAISYGEMFDQLWNLTPYIYAKYDEFVEVKTASETTLDDIRLAYNCAKHVAGTIDNWVADETKRARKADVEKLLQEYNGRLVYDFASTDAIDIYEELVTDFGEDNVEIEVKNGLYETKFMTVKDALAEGLIDPADKEKLFVAELTEPDGDGNRKLISASLRIRVVNNSLADNLKTFYFSLDEDGHFLSVEQDQPANNYKKFAVGVKFDICDYTFVKGEYVKDVDDHGNVPGLHGDNGVHDADWWTELGAGAIPEIFGNSIYAPEGGFYTGAPTGKGADNFPALKVALPLAYEFLAAEDDEDYAGVYAIDTINQIAAGTCKGAPAEWTLVHRYLKYCLEDRYGGSLCTHTKKDIVSLVDKTYELEAETSKASVFATNLEEMVAAREYVREWLKEANADKKYRDNITCYDEIPATEGTKYAGSEYADTVYHYLEAFYNDLLADYNAFKYSFGEIYDYIADVEEKIESGDIKETEGLRTAIMQCAYDLSVVEDLLAYEDKDLKIAYAIDNSAFDDAREFLAHNRVYTGDGDYADVYHLVIKGEDAYVCNNGFHKNLKASYEALKALVAFMETPSVLLGDVNADGSVDLKDAAVILKNYVEGVATDVATGDYDKSGAVDLKDAAAILKAYVNA